MRSDAPVSIEQILVSQGWVDDWVAGNGGDPSMVLFPPFEQYRDRLHLPDRRAPSARSYVVVSMPVGTNVLLDGMRHRGRRVHAPLHLRDGR